MSSKKITGKEKQLSVQPTELAILLDFFFNSIIINNHNVSLLFAKRIVLRTGKTAAYSLQLKQQALSRYLFHLAFENTIEPGYVTEKVFDALIAGVVPVYFGSTKDCKVLLPSQKAAIFLSDFNYDMNALGKYLTYLSNNETAYEEHREWRKYFNATSIVASASASSSASVASVIPTILAKSWPCRICEWAIEKVESL